jgi:hypothetical protein
MRRRRREELRVLLPEQQMTRNATVETLGDEAREAKLALAVYAAAARRIHEQLRHPTRLCRVRGLAVAVKDFLQRAEHQVRQNPSLPPPLSQENLHPFTKFTLVVLYNQSILTTIGMSNTEEPLLETP